MSHIDEKFRPAVIDETVHLFDLLQSEYKSPPMYSCLQLTKFCLVNIVAGYSRQEAEPPPELLEFIKTVLPKIMEDQEDFIETQYLQLHTQGTS